jgi:hypothetical protein
LVVIQHQGELGWQRQEIPTEGLSLRFGEDGLELEAGRARDATAWVMLGSAESEAVLVARDSRGLFVNGLMPLRIAVLEERSEILVRGERLYFSGRDPLVVTRREADGPCRVCNDPTAGAECVACPQCGAVAHEGALAAGGERHCFSHVGRCSGCGLTPGDFDWTPEDDGDA